VLIYNLVSHRSRRAVRAPDFTCEIAGLTRVLGEWAKGVSEGPARRLVIPLEHAYSQRGLRPDRLKGRDAARAQALFAAARGAGCRAYLAHLTYREVGEAITDYDGYYGRGPIDDDGVEMGELIDDELTAEHWTEADEDPGSAIVDLAEGIGWPALLAAVEDLFVDSGGRSLERDARLLATLCRRLPKDARHTGRALAERLVDVLVDAAPDRDGDQELPQEPYRGAALQPLIAAPPRPPPDWARVGVTSCDCADCVMLDAFLRDPRRERERFPLRKDRRLHLHRIIDHEQLDTTHQTERRGSPHTLVCTKTDGSYRRACERHRGDITRRERHDAALAG